VYTRVKALDSGQTLATELLLATFFAALTALGAQVAIRLPVSPVPVTLQVLMVLMVGLTLGSRRGFTSQLTYLAAGALGLPVFAGGTGGVAVLLGPTGGYLMAFPLAAFATGWLSERVVPASRLGSLAASLAGLTVIYGGGTLWLMTWLRAASTPSSQAALLGAWQLGIAPFILVDIAKAILAAVTARGSRLLLLPWIEPDGQTRLQERE